MASFGFDLDLLGFVRSSLVAIKDETTGKDIPCVCIPVAFNQIRVFKDKHDKNHATVKCNMWPVSRGIADYWKSQRSQLGEEVTPFNIPTHRIELGLPDEYRNRMAAQAKKIILAQHAKDWTTPELQDENQNVELRNTIYRMTHFDLCSSVWMHKPKSLAPASVAPSVEVGKGASTAWTPAFDENGNVIGGSKIPEDSDLPF